MTAKVFEFPKKTLSDKKECRTIPLYTEEEVYVLLTAVNVFCVGNVRYNEKNIVQLETEVILLCLQSSLECNYFTDSFKLVVNTILSNAVN